MKKAVLIPILIFALTVSLSALPVFHGSLVTPTGIAGLGEWQDDFQIEWWVEQQANNSWLYRYTISDLDGNPLEGPALSHLVIEVSPNVTENDFWGFGASISLDQYAWELGDFSEGETSFTNGLKLDFGDDGQLDWYFYSWRAPVWGDFIAKGGRTSYAYNLGYNYADPLNDYDPTDAASDGSIGNHILRPDTTVIPEPLSISLLGMGILGMAAGRFYRRK